MLALASRGGRDGDGIFGWRVILGPCYVTQLGMLRNYITMDDLEGHMGDAALRVPDASLARLCAVEQSAKKCTAGEETCCQ
jgi:hypothetical protein